MSRYDELTENPPKLEVKGEPRQVKIDLVSVMCDNRYRWTFERKTPEHDFELWTHGYAYSNFHMSLRKDDLETLRDDLSVDNDNELVDPQRCTFLSNTIFLADKESDK